MQPQPGIYIDYLLKEGFGALERGDLPAAELLLGQAIRHAPGMPDVLCFQAELKARQGHHAEAIELYRLALKADPHYHQCLLGLGREYQALDRLGEAERCYRAALDMVPGYLPARNNLAVLLRAAGRLHESLACYRILLEHAPDNAEAHFNAGLVLLQMGQLLEGWLEYEWRFRKSEAIPLPHLEIPRWQGQALAGKRILVHAEQGYGDTIQFMRYALPLSHMGGTVVAEAQDRTIAPLLACVHGVSDVQIRGEWQPRADVQIPLMSLPLVTQTSLDSIPAFSSYITLPEGTSARWAGLVGGAGAAPRIGLCRAGRPDYGNDRHRSIPPEQLTALLNTAGCAWYSLQIGGSCLRHPVLRDLTGEVRDFIDTAGLITCLDLVITVDTAVAHLAGALGRPVWLLLPAAPDWRWLMDRDDSPWYPTMRIFRQQKPGDWETLLESVAARLAAALTGGMQMTTFPEAARVPDR